MEWLKDVLVSGNGVIISILFVLLISLIGILAKKKIFSFNGKGLSIGYQDLERTIIRQQIEYAENSCMTFITTKDLPIDCDMYRVQYVNEKIFDEMIKWISFNHISSDEKYIEIKQSLVWSIIIRNTEKDFFQSDEMKDMVDNEVRRIICNLCEIRKYYQKRG